MQLKRIKIDHWYQTTQGGVGKCLGIGGRQVKLQIDGKAVWLSPNDVRFEIAKGQEPHLEEVAVHMEEEVQKARILAAWDDHQALKTIAAVLLAGLRLAVHHLENPGIPIAPDSLKNLHAAIGKTKLP